MSRQMQGRSVIWQPVEVRDEKAAVWAQGGTEPGEGDWAVVREGWRRRERRGRRESMFCDEGYGFWSEGWN